MNIKAAAAFLGVTTRTVERYIGKDLTAKYVKEVGGDGRTRDVVDLDKTELQKLKDKFALPRRATRAQVVPEGSTEQGMILSPNAGNVGQQFLAMVEALSKASSVAPLAELNLKLTLDLIAAASLSGLSVGYLKQAIRDRKLKAEKRGRGWNIKRADLDIFVRHL